MGSHKQLSRALGAISSAVLLIDRDRNISYTNEAAENLLGLTALDLAGMPAAKLPEPWRGRILADNKKRIRGQVEPIGEGEKKRWVEWELSPLFEGDDIAGWIMTAEDRTEHYRWQEAARQAERLALTATMVSALAHEIRNPLTAAKGLLQLVGRQRNPAKVLGYADLIQRELDRVSRLLNEFLLLGKPADIAAGFLDCSGFLEELRPLLEGEAVNAGAELTLRAEPGCYIAADYGQMTQVVLNLVRNALEAAGEDGLVELGLSQQDNWVTLSVKDNGPGLTPEVQRKIFQPFFTAKERGKGLGLSVAHAIINNHGGRITAENGPGGGALFTVYLPAYSMEQGKLQHLDVIIVTAEAMVRYPAEQALRAAGCSVLASSEPDGAMLLAERFRPGVVVLDGADLNPRGLDRMRRAFPDARILIMGDPVKGEEIEGVQYIQLPLDYTRFIILIKTLNM